MSIELFKGMVYKDDKVYTRQCSINVNPKSFDREENKFFTKRYNKLGENNFEKWFLINELLTGKVEILSGSNSTLRKLNYFANILWKDPKYKELRDKYDKVFESAITSTKDNRKVAFNEYAQVKEDIDRYVSSFYDAHNSKYINSKKQVRVEECER